LYNANKDNGQGKGGTGSQVIDGVLPLGQAVVDRVKWTFADPIGDIERWSNQYTGHMNDDARWWQDTDGHARRIGLK